ncbi:MAG: hypothetical protein ACYS6K_20355, partial [Planctomycetota bacterium]
SRGQQGYGAAPAGHGRMNGHLLVADLLELDDGTAYRGVRRGVYGDREDVQEQIDEGRLVLDCYIDRSIAGKLLDLASNRVENLFVHVSGGHVQEV